MDEEVLEGRGGYRGRKQDDSKKDGGEGFWEMKKRIETGRGNLYNLSRGKPDQSRGLGKEVEDGNLS